MRKLGEKTLKIKIWKIMLIWEIVLMRKIMFKKENENSGFKKPGG